jgi:CelD/BcsL family acetyltransferase involved in cellulose biosynthesis
MEVRVIRSTEQFDSVSTDWNELIESAETASIFMTWEWNFHWWQHYGKDQDLSIVTVWDNKRIKAILPLYLQQSSVFRTWKVKTARFIGTGGDTSPDYLGPILDPTSATVTVPLLVAFLLDQLPEWAVLRLSDLDRESSFYVELERQSQARRYANATEVSATIAFAALPASWDDYLAGLHRDRRQAIRYARRKIENSHSGRFYVVIDKDQVDDVLASLIELHRRRWQGNPDGHSFSTPEYVGFHGDIVHAAARRQWLRMYCLEADGKRIAVLYCFRFRNQVFYFQAGFDPDYQRLGPGRVLMGYALEHAIGEGNTVFDFLRGEHAYKTQWGKSVCTTHTFTAYRRSLAARLYRLQSEQIPGMKSYLKRRIPYLDRGRGAHGEALGDQHSA